MEVVFFCIYSDVSTGFGKAKVRRLNTHFRLFEDGPREEQAEGLCASGGRTLKGPERDFLGPSSKSLK